MEILNLLTVLYCFYSTTGPAVSSNITRSHSQRVKSTHHHETNNRSIKRSGTGEDFRGRATSFKNGNLPTVVVQITGDKSNSSSLILLCPGTDSNLKNRYILALIRIKYNCVSPIKLQAHFVEGIVIP